MRAEVSPHPPAGAVMARDEHHHEVLQRTLERLDVGRTRTPPRALALTLVCLGAALAATLTWPESSRRLSGFVWVLGVIPVFLLAHYRGWRGAAAVSGLAMALMVGAVLYRTVIADQPVDWWLFGIGTGLVVPATLGAGVLSESLHREKLLALVLAYRDPLTGLANRRLLREHAVRMMAEADREGARLGMISLDVARLKMVNENLGYEAGDEALQLVADRMDDSMRASDVVARVGGDEFAAVLLDEDGPEGIVAAVRRLEKRFSLPFHVGGRTVHLEPRFGVAWYPDHGEGFDELLTRAEEARPGGEASDRVGMHAVEEADWSDSPDRLALAQDLREALDRDGLLDWYQLVYRCDDGRPVGAEALVRWEHPEMGRLSAGEFVPFAERIGLVGRLDRWVARRALERAAAWCGDGGLSWVAINVAPATLEQGDFAGDLAAAARELGVDPSRLVIEITERAAMKDLDRTAETLRRLKERGFRVAVDDFGVGHSSLAYLERFRADLLKVDMLFLHSREESPQRESLLRGIIALGKGIDLEVVAEGVEEADQMDWLRREDQCDFAQGYHLCRPGPVDEIEPLARSGRPFDAPAEGG